jgi:hypothetical protein
MFPSLRGGDKLMQIISSNFKNRTIMENMIESARERKNSIDPIVKERSGKVVDLVRVVNRKKALHNEKKYKFIREAFDQNYNKFN